MKSAHNNLMQRALAIKDLNTTLTDEEKRKMLVELKFMGFEHEVANFALKSIQYQSL
jgi:hypothetical protein